MFVTNTGEPIRRGTFTTAWSRAIRDADVGHVRFHDLRHHYASALISAGCSVKAVQAGLGHRSATETLQTHSPLWPSDADRTRAAIDDLWDSSCVTDVSSGEVAKG